MKKFIVLLGILLLVAGCSQTVLEKDEKTDPDGVPEQDDELPPEPDAPNTEEQQTEDMGEANIDEIKDAMKISDKLMVYPSSKSFETETRYKYALGVSSIKTAPFKVLIETKFNSAKDNYGNSVIVNETLVNKWVKNNSFILEVPQNSFVYSPLNVEVDRDAKKGVYTFDLYAYDYERISQNYKPVYHNIKLTMVVS